MTPGEIIRKKLDDRGWTQLDLAEVLGRPLQSINLIVAGKKSITPETAIGLAAAFGDKAEEWLLAESKYRLGLVEEPDSESVRARANLFDIAPVKDMEKRGWIGKTATADELKEQLLKFYGVGSLGSAPSIAASMRRSAGDEPMNAAQRAWCFRAKNIARMVPAAEFTEQSFAKGIKKLRELAAWPESARHVTTAMSEMGIRFVVVEHLPKSEVDGAALWLDEKSPVIAISLRRDRIDNFWHTVGHELSHIANRDAPHVDTNIVGEGKVSPAELSATERRADREAAETWIAAAELESFTKRVGPLYSRTKINGFANRIKIHPGIIVGQLQHRGEVSYDSHRAALVKIRDIVVSTALTDGWGQTIEV